MSQNNKENYLISKKTLTSLSGEKKTDAWLMNLGLREIRICFDELGRRNSYLRDPNYAENSGYGLTWTNLHTFRSTKSIFCASFSYALKLPGMLEVMRKHKEEGYASIVGLSVYTFANSGKYRELGRRADVNKFFLNGCDLGKEGAVPVREDVTTASPSKSRISNLPLSKTTANPLLLKITSSNASISKPTDAYSSVTKSTTTNFGVSANVGNHPFNQHQVEMESQQKMPMLSAYHSSAYQHMVDSQLTTISQVNTTRSNNYLNTITKKKKIKGIAQHHPSKSNPTVIDLVDSSDDEQQNILSKKRKRVKVKEEDEDDSAHLKPINHRENILLSSLKRMGFRADEIMPAIRVNDGKANISQFPISFQVNKLMTWMVTQREEAAEARLMDHARMLSEESARECASKQEVEEMKLLTQPISYLLGDENRNGGTRSGYFSDSFLLNSSKRGRSLLSGFCSGKDDHTKKLIIKILFLEKKSFKWYGRSNVAAYFSNDLPKLLEDIAKKNSSEVAKSIREIINTIEKAMYSLAEQDTSFGVPKLFVRATECANEEHGSLKKFGYEDDNEVEIVKCARESKTIQIVDLID